MSAKACVACGKLIAQSFTTCSFCKAEQPAQAAPAPQKEKRCDACRRPYAAKLEECPFCARAKVGAGTAPSSSSSKAAAASPSSGRLPHLEGSRVEEDDEGHRLVSSLLFFGIPLALGATWGIAQSMMGNRLGESSVFGPSMAVGIVVAPAFAVLFVRRVVGGNLGDAVDDVGLPKLAGYVAGAAAVALLPTALTIMGIVLWFNGLAVSDREQDVACKAGSIVHNMRKGIDSGWSVSYTCEIEGQPLVGTVDRIMTKPELEENSPIKLRAIKGRAGIWLRVSDPLPPTAITTPSSR